jgi:hypothetical protein
MKPASAETKSTTSKSNVVGVCERNPFGGWRVLPECSAAEPFCGGPHRTQPARSDKYGVGERRNQPAASRSSPAACLPAYVAVIPLYSGGHR